jgi:two-component sensor histidine kinase
MARDTLAKELGSVNPIDKTTSRTLELENLCKDGSIIPVEVKVTLLRDAIGQPYGLLGITRDIAERKQAEALLKSSLKEKEILLQEIHHRVKNNLQIISSLLELQANNIENKQAIAAFQDSQARIRSMAIIHEKLYRSEALAQVDLAEYIQELTVSLCRSYMAKKHEIDLNIEVERLFLDIDTAVPCGLILNELVSNSLKHAFPDGQDGKIWVRLHTTDSGQIRMSVGDNGVGFPAGFDARPTSSLGLQLVNTLVGQLNGLLKIERVPTTLISITFAVRGEEEKEI